MKNERKKVSVALAVSVMFLALTLFSVSASDLSYTDETKNLTLTYDNLGRLTVKQSSEQQYNYSYDGQYFGSLDNITSSNYSDAFTYDKEMRVVTEIKIIDDQVFTRDYTYDSADRVVLLDSIAYLYNKQGSVRKLGDYVNDSSYSAFGSLLNRTYGSGLVTRYSYDPQNNRLTSIISSVQNLSYTYDNVGNIMTINDAVNARLHNITYDGLDRMMSAKIGTDQYLYSYNPTGNILKIVKNNESKKFVYGGLQAHAPSKIIEGSAGVDVHNPKEIMTDSKNKTYEFFLVNEMNSSITANLSVSFGDGKTADSNLNIIINASGNVWAFVQNNYSHGGDYEINFSAASSGTSDTESTDIKFGTRADSLRIDTTNVTQETMNFTIHNDISETVTNVAWQCSAANSTSSVNLGGNSFLSAIFQANYSSPGQKEMQCTATSDDGNESKSIDFTIPGIEINSYDVLLSNTSHQIVSFDVKNNYHDLETNISVDADTHHFSRKINISSQNTLMVFTEINYTNDGTNTFQVTTTANGTSDEYVNTFDIKGAVIENYSRTINGTVAHISFQVRNLWLPGYVTWNVSNPNQGSTVYLNNNQSTTVTIDSTYSTETNNVVEITATRTSYTDHYSDSFLVKPLQIQSVTAFNASSTPLFEIIAKNNLQINQSFNWRLDTGAANITGTTATAIANMTFIFIQAPAYPSKDLVYHTTSTINSTQYNDTASMVVIP